MRGIPAAGCPNSVAVRSWAKLAAVSRRSGKALKEFGGPAVPACPASKRPALRKLWTKGVPVLAGIACVGLSGLGTKGRLARLSKCPDPNVTP